MSFIPVDIVFYQHKEISRNEQLSSFVLVMSRNLMNQNYVHVQYFLRERIMEFNATFNNIWVISWRLVLLVGETRRKPLNCRKSMTNFIT